MYPLRRKKYAKFRRWTIRKTHVIGAIWLLGVAISSPEYLMFRTRPFCFNRRLFRDCHPHWPASTSQKYTVL